LFTVSDNGPGIPPEYHDLIFRKFGQVEMPRSPRTRSSGLGLTFCKLVVERHRGRIWVKSAEGEGSSFYIELPCDPAQMEAPTMTTPTAAAIATTAGR
jgi:signal transduction histidine kinase